VRCCEPPFRDLEDIEVSQQHTLPTCCHIDRGVLVRKQVCKTEHALLQVRYSDIGSVEGIVADMRAWLDAHPGVDCSLPLFVGLGSLDNHACNLSVVVRRLYRVSLHLQARSWYINSFGTKEGIVPTSHLSQRHALGTPPPKPFQGGNLW